MVLKKQEFKDDEIPIFDEACVYKRGEYWQFRLWLPKENKYARKSLRTRSESTATERGKAAYLETYGNLQQGKSYKVVTNYRMPLVNHCYYKVFSNTTVEWE